MNLFVMNILNFPRFALPALLILTTFFTASGAPTNSVPELASFELRDQYDNPHTISFPATNVTLMTVADRKGSEQINGWIAPVKERYGERIAIEGIADVSTVPRLLRSMVQKQFKKDRAYPVMLDWDGPVAHSFNYQKDEANFFVIDRQGRITGCFSGATNEVALKALFASIDLAISKSSP
jgi:hypothetical protein